MKSKSKEHQMTHLFLCNSKIPQQLQKKVANSLIFNNPRK